MQKQFIYLAFASCMIMASCGTKSNCKDLATTDDIRVDQCGYMIGTEKMAFSVEPVESFFVCNCSGEIVYSGKAEAPQFWAEANDTIQRLTFTSLDTEGTYFITTDQQTRSYMFRICKNPYEQVCTDAVRALYYNRTAMAIDSAFGTGAWARPAGHPDTAVMIHKSAASATRPEGTIISSPLGWYDAGDYNKYIVNSSITTYTMLLAAYMNQDMAKVTNLNIPESKNNIADIIDETLYNLRWMLTMQDPEDGGVYHKLTTLSFEDFIMPHECKKQRYVVAKGTAAALDLAATAAMAYRTLPTWGEELRPLADSCLTVAKKAYAWAEKNPDVKFRNPEDVSTGEYGDFFFDDEWFWASAEMMLATGEKKYADNMNKYNKEYDVPSWGYVGILGHYSLALADNKEAYNGIVAQDNIVKVADKLLTNEQASPIAISLIKYDWGSNSSIANEGMVKLIAKQLTGDNKYYNSALNDLHYILGRNGTGYSYVTGNGSKLSMHPHHRPSSADGVEMPVPGFLIGGPNIIVPTDCETPNRGEYPATAYGDEECSYSTNEVAINWNAPLVFLSWGICANR
jgi:endoglucanase